MFVHHVKFALQRDSGAPDRSFLEQAPEQRYAVRHAARGENLGSGFAASGAQSLRASELPRSPRAASAKDGP